MIHVYLDTEEYPQHQTIEENLFDYVINKPTTRDLVKSIDRELLYSYKVDKVLQGVFSKIDLTDVRVATNIIEGNKVFLMKDPQLRPYADKMQAMKFPYLYAYYEKNPEHILVIYKDHMKTQEQSRLLHSLTMLDQTKLNVHVHIVYQEKDLLYTTFLNHLEHEVYGSLVKPEPINISDLELPTQADVESIQNIIKTY